jgi:hypothetical protein
VGEGRTEGAVKTRRLETGIRKQERQRFVILSKTKRSEESVFDPDPSAALRMTANPCTLAKSARYLAPFASFRHLVTMDT